MMLEITINGEHGKQTITILKDAVVTQANVTAYCNGPGTPIHGTMRLTTQRPNQQ